MKYTIEKKPKIIRASSFSYSELQPKDIPPPYYPKIVEAKDLEREVRAAFGTMFNEDLVGLFLDLFEYPLTTEQLYSMAFWWKLWIEYGERDYVGMLISLHRKYKKEKEREDGSTEQNKGTTGRDEG